MARLRLDDETEISLPLASIRRAKLVLTEALIAATAEAPQSN
jgi:ribosome maturation factor RimP